MKPSVGRQRFLTRFLLRMIWNKGVSPKLLLNFTVQYATMRVQKKQEGLKLNGTHRLLIYADNANLSPESIQTTKKNTDFILYKEPTRCNFGSSRVLNRLWHSAVGNRPWTSLLDIYHPDPWYAPVAATTVFSTPDDGCKKRPKHEEWSCSY
jgi:hypothetical protein